MDDHFTPIFNEVLEALCRINLSPYETRVLMAIWRKTYGFIEKSTGLRKKNDIISTSQLAKMCNIDKRNVSRALKGLKDKGVISRDDKKTGFSKQFMKLLSSVEMTNKKESSVEMTKVDGKDDKSSSVEMTPVIATDTGGSSLLTPQIESIKETIKENKTKIVNYELTTEFGNSEINELIKYFLEVIKLPKEDCSKRTSRRYWWLLLKESKTGVEGVRWLIDLLKNDEFYRNNVTSGRDLYYKRIKIISRRRGNIPRIASADDFI